MAVWRLDVIIQVFKKACNRDFALDGDEIENNIGIRYEMDLPLIARNPVSVFNGHLILIDEQVTRKRGNFTVKRELVAPIMCPGRP